MIALLAAALCVLANGFFVAAEFAMTKVRLTALQALAKNGDVRAKRAQHVVQHLDGFLSATQLGITLASLGLGWLGEPALAILIHPVLQILQVPERFTHGISLSVAFATITLLHIVIGELIPKSLALQKPVSIVRYAARPLEIFYAVAYPALWVLNLFSRWGLRCVGLSSMNHAEGVLSAEELRMLIEASSQGADLHETKRALMERVLRSTDRAARAIMIPRVDMALLSLADPFDVSMDRVRRYGYSRYPLSENGDPDKIVGYVYVKDLLMVPQTPKGGLQSLKRELLFVPESRTVGELLREFQQTKIPMAIVVDEYGGTSGLVTLEDAVEEIVGEIQDELDAEPQRLMLREDGSVVADGTVLMEELQLEGLVAPPLEGGETLAGYLVARLERLAYPGDHIRLGRYEAIVEDVRRRRVHRVLLKPLPPENGKEVSPSATSNLSS